MDDLLTQFLAEGEELMENRPLDFFESYMSPETQTASGVPIVWFVAWCRANDLLSDSFREAIENFPKSDVRNTMAFRDFCDRYTEGSLKPEHLSERGAQFARKYYGTGWSHTYFEDLEALFPDVESFDQLADKPENYEAVSRVLSKRLAEFSQGTPD
ncbi:hypothetical protein NMA58_25565 (plasmid) [Rhizobium sp. YTUHZ045]|uniref:DUF7832 domain-containing protein n=1 Tax=Rhizobium sp. YTUHZ045 TaxID=2962888 RepID=UPI003DAA349A